MTTIAILLAGILLGAQDVPQSNPQTPATGSTPPVGVAQNASDTEAQANPILRREPLAQPTPGAPLKPISANPEFRQKVAQFGAALEAQQTQTEAARAGAQ